MSKNAKQIQIKSILVIAKVQHLFFSQLKGIQFSVTEK